MYACHKCLTPWQSQAARQPGVKESCPSCSAYLHCCLNCRFYDPSKPRQCYISTIEGVTDKAGANFCDEFEFKDAASHPAPAKDNADAFDALFGGALQDDEPRPPTSFDDLFKS